MRRPGHLAPVSPVSFFNFALRLLFGLFLFCFVFTRDFI